MRYYKAEEDSLFRSTPTSLAKKAEYLSARVEEIDTHLIDILDPETSEIVDTVFVSHLDTIGTLADMEACTKEEKEDKQHFKAQFEDEVQRLNHGYEVRITGQKKLGFAKRYKTSKLWKRQLKEVACTRAEIRSIKEKRLGRNDKGPSRNYIAGENLTLINMIKEKNDHWAETNHVVNKATGEVKKISELTSTKEQNAKGMYATVKAYGRIGLELGLTFGMITVTTPGAYHGNPQHAGKNHSWNGASSRDGHDLLIKEWGNLRKEVNRHRLLEMGLNFFGYRFQEFHKSGQVHWHIPMFCDQDHIEVVEALFREKFSGRPDFKWQSDKAIIENEDGSEDRTNRIEDGTKAESYCYKYVMKEIAFDASEGDKPTCHIIEAQRKSGKIIRAYQPFGVKLAMTKIKIIRKLGMLHDQEAFNEKNNITFAVRMMKSKKIKPSNMIAHFIKHLSDKIEIVYSEKTNSIGEVSKSPIALTDLQFGVSYKIPTFWGQLSQPFAGATLAATVKVSGSSKPKTPKKWDELTEEEKEQAIEEEKKRKEQWRINREKSGKEPLVAVGVTLDKMVQDLREIGAFA